MVEGLVRREKSLVVEGLVKRGKRKPRALLKKGAGREILLNSFLILFSSAFASSSGPKMEGRIIVVIWGVGGG